MHKLKYSFVRYVRHRIFSNHFSIASTPVLITHNICNYITLLGINKWRKSLLDRFLFLRIAVLYLYMCLVEVKVCIKSSLNLKQLLKEDNVSVEINIMLATKHECFELFLSELLHFLVLLTLSKDYMVSTIWIMLRFFYNIWRIPNCYLKLCTFFIVVI